MTVGQLFYLVSRLSLLFYLLGGLVGQANKPASRRASPFRICPKLEHIHHTPCGNDVLRGEPD